MRGYTPDKYIEVVERSKDEVLQRFMQDEQDFIADIKGGQFKTFVDLGAGYGRLLPFFDKIPHQQVIAVEINPAMCAELMKRASQYKNVTIMQRDFLGLHDILPEHISQPVFLLLQNTLGTIEQGEYKEVLRAMATEAGQRRGQLVLSLFRQPALSGWGVKMYGLIESMIGKVDNSQSNFETGLFTTTTGYTSKWWTDEELDEIRGLGRLTKELMTDEYAILLLNFD